MRPAFSVVFLTTLIGAGQGLFLALFAGLLRNVPDRFLVVGSAISIALAALGLLASFFHLGRPERAWRSAAMWRTSWLSREVIALPAFVAGAAACFLFPGHLFLETAVLALCLALFLCTAMIYACLRFIEEWAQPLTVVNFILLGLSSGSVLASALAALAGEQRALALAAPLALVVTLVAWASRTAAWRRNAALRHRSTLQSATGIASARLAQTSMGMSAGSFNTREFFHRASAAALRRIKGIAIVLGFALPALLIAGVIVGVLPELACVAALVAQAPGLIADRWLFFAQAKHPQNLYYQVVS